MRIGMCAKRDDLVNLLKQQYGEDIIAVGLDMRGFLITLTATPDGSSWTALEVYTTGRTCIRAMGGSMNVLLPDEGMEG